MFSIVLSLLIFPPSFSSLMLKKRTGIMLRCILFVSLIPAETNSTRSALYGFFSRSIRVILNLTRLTRFSAFLQESVKSAMLCLAYMCKSQELVALPPKCFKKIVNMPGKRHVYG